MKEEEFINVEWCVQVTGQVVPEDSTSLILLCLWKSNHPTINREILVKLNILEHCGENLTSLTNTDIFTL
jgi:hypothetical protein